MPSKKSDDQKLADHANELYWRSGQSVNQIAEVMDLSKSGLYALIRPLSAERACPECGDGLVFTNRTTEQKAVASCPGCEYADEAPGASSRARPPKKKARRRKTAAAQPEGAPGTDLETGAGEAAVRVGGAAVRDTNGRRGLRSNRILWASVLLGVAAGLYVARRSR